MGPARFNDAQEHPGSLLHGPRPSPLKINKESHKATYKSSSSSSSSSSAGGLPTTRPGKQIHQRRPVIIYTYSPKVIHTQPCDFMALVQKLTGHSRSDYSPEHDIIVDRPAAGDTRKQGSSLTAPIFKIPDPCLAEIPLFKPKSTELIRSYSGPLHAVAEFDVDVAVGDHERTA